MTEDEQKALDGPETREAVDKARKSTERKPRRRVEPEAPEEKPALEPRGYVRSEALVAHNEARRNSQSVRDVQDALAEIDWRVRADPAGYWGDRTAAAGKAVTGETDPVKVALALGFVVL